MIREPRTLRFAGGFLIAAPLVFLIGEAVAAAAWSNPSYSYLGNFISDLGVPVPTTLDGRSVNSPLAAVMNTAFVLSGTLVAAAVALALRPRTLSRAGRVVYALAMAYGAGMIIIAVFHETPDWMAPWHGFGAFLVIPGGNAAIVILGFLPRQFGLPHGLAIGLRAVGATGLAGLLAFTTFPGEHIGLLERIAVYPLPVAQVLVGTALAVHAVRLSGTRRIDPAPQ
jgi:hypothetical membrane protein